MGHVCVVSNHGRGSDGRVAITPKSFHESRVERVDGIIGVERVDGIIIRNNLSPKVAVNTISE